MAQHGFTFTTLPGKARRLSRNSGTALGDPTARTIAHRCLGRAHARFGQHDEAIEHLQHAPTLASRYRDKAPGSAGTLADN